MPTGGCRPCGLVAAYRARGRLLPPQATLLLAGVAGLPFRLALASTSRPFEGGLGRGLVVGGRPCMGAGCG
ncbi:hypothetical protein GW17_00011706 [Ensete ventricosum]|nr:hypothetical protein GW17_00011706 [Ensete ventricosum]